MKIFTFSPTKLHKHENKWKFHSLPFLHFLGYQTKSQLSSQQVHKTKNNKQFCFLFLSIIFLKMKQKNPLFHNDQFRKKRKLQQKNFIFYWLPPFSQQPNKKLLNFLCDQNAKMGSMSSSWGLKPLPFLLHAASIANQNTSWVQWMNYPPQLNGQMAWNKAFISTLDHVFQTT